MGRSFHRPPRWDEFIWKRDWNWCGEIKKRSYCKTRKWRPWKHNEIPWRGGSNVLTSYTVKYCYQLLVFCSMTFVWTGAFGIRPLGNVTLLNLALSSRMHLELSGSFFNHWVRTSRTLPTSINFCRVKVLEEGTVVDRNYTSSVGGWEEVCWIFSTFIWHGSEGGVPRGNFLQLDIKPIVLMYATRTQMKPGPSSLKTPPLEIPILPSF